MRALFGAFLLLAIAVSAGAQEIAPGTYIYKVTHSEHGDMGTHSVTVAPSGEGLMVRTERNLKIKLAFITVFRDETIAVETWRDGRMISYESTTDDGDEVYSIMAQAEGERLKIQGKESETSVPLGLFPSNPWNQRIVEQSAVMDTSDGSIKEIAVEALGSKELIVGEKVVQARGYRLTGGLERSLWFDETGRWVRMEIPRDGDIVIFELQ